MSLTIPPKAVTLQHNADPNAHEILERKTSSITDTVSTTVNVTLSSNTIYTFTKQLTSLTLSTASGFTYAGINFIAGNIATTFSTPNTWIFNGDDCTPQRVFIPTPNSCYRLAIEALGDRFVCDVQKYATTQDYIS